MNLETAIRENTAALQALTAALTNDRAPRATPAIPVQPAAADKAQAEELAPALNYEAHVKPLVIKLAAVDKPKVLSILAGWQVNKGSEVAVECLPEFKKQLEDALNG